MRRDDFLKLVQKALTKIPPELQNALENVAILVEDWPDPALMEEISDNPHEVVYGLYQGTPLPERGADYANTTPDVILLYQGPLEEDFQNREDLTREIETTLVHEIAHYIGFDEETLERYGYG
jgi:predicted Zn-dependent protease with MMP-like domain